MPSELERVEAIAAASPDLTTPIATTSRFTAADLIGDPDAEAVLYFHGTPDSRLARHPDPLATRCAGVRLVAVDRPGFGHSTLDESATPVSFAAEVRHLLDVLEIDHVSVLAWSAGAVWALGFAAMYPECTSKVTIVGGLVPFEAFQDSAVRADAGDARMGMVETAQDLGPEMAAELIGPLLLPDPATAATVLEHLGATHDEDHDELTPIPGAREQMAAAVLDAARQGTGGVVRDLEVHTSASTFDLGDVRCPVHLITGETDATCPPAFARWYADHLTDARVEVVPRAGHMLLLTRWTQILAESVATQP